MGFRRTPLAWRGITHDRKRFALSLAAIMFATVLMFMQMGFLNAVFDSQVVLLRRLNADLILTNKSKLHMGVNEPLARRRLEEARQVPGVAAVYPLYIEGDRSFWKNAETQRLYLIRVIGLDPADPVFLGTSLEPFAAGLQQEDAALIDIRSKRFIGPRHPGVRTELAGHRIRVIGSFSLGTDFDFDGTAILSEATFLRIFPSQQTAGPNIGRVELGLVRLGAGVSPLQVRAELEKTLPADIHVWTKQELIEQEIHFWRTFTPLGFIFGLGLAVGFVVGVVVCSQILYTSVLDRMPLFGTLRAIGYTNGYVMKLVGSEAVLLSILAFLPGVALSAFLYRFLTSLIGYEMFLTAPRVALILSLTLGMSLIAALVALRKALTADPAEVFK